MKPQGKQNFTISSSLFLLAVAFYFLAKHILLLKTVELVALPYIALFFYTTSLLAVLLVNKASKKSTAQFNNTFMSLSGGKFMISIFVLAIYIFMKYPNGKAFAITYMVGFLLFSAAEVYFMLKGLKNSKANS